MTLPARLGRLLDDCGDALVDGDARRRVESAASLYRHTDAECALECHLSTRGARTDLVVRTFAADRDVLLSQVERSQSVRAFMNSWCDDELVDLPFVELEHDLDVVRAAPWIGPAIEPLLRQTVDAIVQGRGHASPSAWKSTVLARCAIEALGERDERWAKRIDEVFHLLPSRSCINHLALGSARPERARECVRLIVSLERRDAAGFFSAIGWRGDAHRLARLAESLLPWEARIELDVDVELDGCAPGTATYADFRAPRVKDSVLTALLRRLVQGGMVAAPVHDALQRWIQRSDAVLNRVITFKICDDGSRTSAKAYLGALHESS